METFLVCNLSRSIFYLYLQASSIRVLCFGYRVPLHDFTSVFFMRSYASASGFLLDESCIQLFFRVLSLEDQFIQPCVYSLALHEFLICSRTLLGKHRNCFALFVIIKTLWYYCRNISCSNNFPLFDDDKQAFFLTKNYSLRSGYIIMFKVLSKTYSALMIFSSPCVQQLFCKSF